MVLREDGEVGALAGGIADELGGAVEVGGRTEGLEAEEWSMVCTVRSRGIPTSGASCIKAILYIGGIARQRVLKVACGHSAQSISPWCSPHPHLSG
jgi:hypothetical protein